MDYVTTTAIASPQLDWTRTLRTPLRKPAWRTYLYFVLISVLAVVGVVYIFCAALASGLLIVTLVGIPLLALVVMSGRAWNRLYRSLARLTGVTIDAPPQFVRPPGRLHTVSGRPDRRGGVAQSGIPDAARGAHDADRLLRDCWRRDVCGVGVVTRGVVGVRRAVHLLRRTVDSLWAYSLLAVGGVVALYLLGWVMLGLSRAHAWLARTLLGPTERESRVVQLERARADVVDDSAATLRRVERDLHDGTQARLITVAMALARADEHLATSGDVTRARELVTDALANTKDTLTELRDLVRGIRPPALDLGLGPAIETLAARNPIPVDVTVDLPVRPSIGVETMAYFCVAELLANVSKHSGASHAAVRVVSDAHELRIVVQDDGSGGVQVGNGSGLTGLRDRLAMVDGRLEIDSPDGGPTVVTVVVPPGAEQ
jgi:signal transduction histidine kinase